MRAREAKLYSFVLFSFALVFVGCGDDDDSGADASTETDAGDASADAEPTLDGGDAGSDTDANVTDDAASDAAEGAFVSCDAKSATAGSGLAGTCTEYPTRTDGSSLEAGCTGGGGMVVMRPCETTDAVGRCTLGMGTSDERVLYYYSSFVAPDSMSTEDYAESRCMTTMGVWETL